MNDAESSGRVAAIQPSSAEGSALMQIISRAASDPAYDVAKLQALLMVKKEWEADEARKAFVVALSKFKESPPEIFKTRQVDYQLSTGGRTKYKHAALDDASQAIGLALSAVGISHRWNVEQKEKIKVTCTLTHALGHSESVAMEAMPDTSGSKNSIQAIGSTVSYLQRYTLFAAAGIAPKNVDDDGRGGVEIHQMDPRQKENYLAQIAALTDRKSAEVLWATIAAECTKVGDIAAYNELKAAMAAKVKVISKAEGGTI